MQAILQKTFPFFKNPASLQRGIHREDIFPAGNCSFLCTEINRQLLYLYLVHYFSTILFSLRHPDFPLLNPVRGHPAYSDQRPGPFAYSNKTVRRLPLSTFSIAAVLFLTISYSFPFLPRKPARFPNRNSSTPRTVLLLRHRVLTFQLKMSSAERHIAVVCS